MSAGAGAGEHDTQTYLGQRKRSSIVSAFNRVKDKTQNKMSDSEGSSSRKAWVNRGRWGVSNSKKKKNIGSGSDSKSSSRQSKFVALLGSLNNADSFVLDTINYFVFFLLFTSVVLGRLNQTTPALFRASIEQQFAPKQSQHFRTDIEHDTVQHHLSFEPWFDHVNTIEQVWAFLRVGFLHHAIPQTHVLVRSDGQKVTVDLHEGAHLLGDFRLVQKRRGPGPECLSVALETKEDAAKKKLCPHQEPDGTWSHESFGGPNNDMFKWTDDPNIAINSVLPRPQGQYGLGGFSVYFPVPFNKTGWSEILTSLQDNNFIDGRTAAIIVEFALYNANVNLMATVTLVFDMPVYGGVDTAKFIRVADLFNYDETLDIVIACFEVALGLYWVRYVFHEIQQLRKSSLKKYYAVFWNLIEHLNLMILGTVMIARLINDNVAAQLLAIQTSGNTRYVNWIPLMYSESVVRNLSAFNAVLMWIKALRFVRISPRMAMLEMVLSIAMYNLFAFLVLFFIVYIGFVQAYFMVFHVAIDKFESVSTSFYTLFEKILGHFDFDKLQDENWLLGPLLFFMFVIIMFFVLMNLLLSILREAYSTMRRQMATNKTEMNQKMQDAKKALVRMGTGLVSHGSKRSLLIGNGESARKLLSKAISDRFRQTPRSPTSDPQSRDAFGRMLKEKSGKGKVWSRFDATNDEKSSISSIATVEPRYERPSISSVGTATCHSKHSGSIFSSTNIQEQDAFVRSIGGRKLGWQITSTLGTPTGILRRSESESSLSSAKYRAESEAAAAAAAATVNEPLEHVSDMDGDEEHKNTTEEDDYLSDDYQHTHFEDDPSAAYSFSEQ